MSTVHEKPICSIKSAVLPLPKYAVNLKSVAMGERDRRHSADFQLHDLESRTLNLNPAPTSDPNEPLNWPRWRKFYSMTLVALNTLFSYTVLCIAVPSWSVMTKELDWTFEELNNSYAMALAAIGIGCIFQVPLAIDYGRRPVYLWSTGLIIAGAAWSAKMTRVWELYTTQILMGLGTATSEILIELVISDMFFIHERASMNGLYLVFCYLGNNMSQVAGGFVTQAQGWRWNYWYCLIFVSVLWLLFLFTFEETKFLPDTNTELQPKEFPQDVAEPVSNARPWVDATVPIRPLKQRYSFITKETGRNLTLWRSWTGPFVILATFPMVLFVAIEYGLSVAWTSIMSTLTSQYLGRKPYEWSPGAIGNINISPFVGTVIGTLLGGVMCDISVVKLSKWNNGVFNPEMRLYSAIIPFLAMIASLFVFGYGFYLEKHWSVPVVAYGLASFGGTALSDTLLTYLMDCYREIIGQSLIGVVFVQNILPTASVFALQPWIRKVGLNYVFVTCGAISIAAFALLFPMIYFGRHIRKHTSNAYKNFRECYIRE